MFPEKCITKGPDKPLCRGSSTIWVLPQRMFSPQSFWGQLNYQGSPHCWSLHLRGSVGKRYPSRCLGSKWIGPRNELITAATGRSVAISHQLRSCSNCKLVSVRKHTLILWNVFNKRESFSSGFWSWGCQAVSCFPPPLPDWSAINLSPSSFEISLQGVEELGVCLCALHFVNMLSLWNHKESL